MYIGSLIENYDEYIYACEALNQYIRGGGTALLEAYSEGIIIPLDESKKIKEKRELKRLRKRELIPQEILVRTGRIDSFYDPFHDTDNEMKYDDDASEKSINKNIRFNSYDYNHSNPYNIDNINRFIEKRNRYEEGSNHRPFSPKTIIKLNKAKIFNDNIGKSTAYRFSDEREVDKINKLLKANGFNELTQDQLRSGDFELTKQDNSDNTSKPSTSTQQAQSISNVVNKEEPPKPVEKPKPTKSHKHKHKQSASTQQQAYSIANTIKSSEETMSNTEKQETLSQIQDKTKKVLNTSEHQPKSVLARMVAAMQNLYRKWLDKKNQAKANGEDVGFFSNILRIILNCIDKLMWKIRNWSDGRKSDHYNSR